MRDSVSNETESLLDGRRHFSIQTLGGSTKDYYIGTPTADDVRKADWEHAKTYNRALKEGVFTMGEMTEILLSRNIIGPDYEKTGEELKVSLAEKIVSMERELDKDARVQLAFEVAKLREEVFQWNHRMTGPMANTCESMSNDARTEYLTSAVVQDKAGNRIWPSFDDYRNEKDLALQTKARFEVMLWLEGVDSDFLDKSPERVVLNALMEEGTSDVETDSTELDVSAEMAAEVSSEPTQSTELGSKVKTRTKKSK